MEKKITILALQMESIIADIGKNVEKVEGMLEKELSQRSADFVILPEVWTCGWYCPGFAYCNEKLEAAKSVEMLKRISKKYNTNILGGSIIEQKEDGTLRNSCPVINRSGELVCTYEKNHLFSYYGDNEGEYITKGNNPVMVNLDGVNVGLTICYDIRFPEIYRAYRKTGADLLVNMAAWGYKKKIPWDSMTTSRAVENQTYFVALTQTGNLKNGEKNLGHSMILNYKGDIIDEIDTDEGFIRATIDLEEMYSFRNKCRVLEDVKQVYEVIKK